MLILTERFVFSFNFLVLLCLQVVLMSGSGTSFFCLGHPTDLDWFRDVFPVENDVQIFDCMFHGRRFDDMWYFQQPPLTPTKRLADGWDDLDDDTESEINNETLIG